MGPTRPWGTHPLDAPAEALWPRDSTDGVQGPLMELGAELSEAQGRLYVLSPTQMATAPRQASTGVVCTGSKGQKAQSDTRSISNFILRILLPTGWVNNQKLCLLEDSATGGAAAFSNYQVHPHVAANGVL